jgi:hypothetical protein
VKHEKQNKKKKKPDLKGLLPLEKCRGEKFI